MGSLILLMLYQVPFITKICNLFKRDPDLRPRRGEKRTLTPHKRSLAATSKDRQDIADNLTQAFLCGATTSCRNITASSDTTVEYKAFDPGSDDNFGFKNFLDLDSFVDPPRNHGRGCFSNIFSLMAFAFLTLGMENIFRSLEEDLLEPRPQYDKTPVSFSEYSTEEFIHFFRFTKPQAYQVMNSLLPLDEHPDGFTACGHKFTWEAGFVLFLRRMATPMPFSQMEKEMRRSSSALCPAFNAMTNYLYKRWIHLIDFRKPGGDIKGAAAPAALGCSRARKCGRRA
jgi:hypothetical protein